MYTPLQAPLKITCPLPPWVQSCPLLHPIATTVLISYHHSSLARHRTRVNGIM